MAIAKFGTWCAVTNVKGFARWELGGNLAKEIIQVTQEE